MQRKDERSNGMLRFASMVTRCKLLQVATEMNGVAMQKARKLLDIVHMMSNLLGADLDHQTLAILIALCNHGINLQVLTVVVKELLQDFATVSEKANH